MAATNEDSSIIIAATNCLTCFVRLSDINQLSQSFEFGSGKSVGNGLEAILTATFRLLNTGEHILQDQALVSVGHLVYHLVQRLQGVLGEANIAKLLEQVVLRLSKARFSSCIQNLITCILKLIGKFGSAIIDLLRTK